MCSYSIVDNDDDNDDSSHLRKNVCTPLGNDKIAVVQYTIDNSSSVLPFQSGGGASSRTKKRSTTKMSKRGRSKSIAKGFGKSIFRRRKSSSKKRKRSRSRSRSRLRTVKTYRSKKDQFLRDQPPRIDGSGSGSGSVEYPRQQSSLTDVNGSVKQMPSTELNVASSAVTPPGPPPPPVPLSPSLGNRSGSNLDNSFQRRRKGERSCIGCTITNNIKVPCVSERLCSTCDLDILQISMCP